MSLAESERAFCPDILTRIEALLAELGLNDEEIVIRMTGCPNGCARPYMAEIAFVGKAPEQVPALPWAAMKSSTRLNRLLQGDR